MKDVACVLLGAGMSSRMGKPKLLMCVRGKTVFEIALANHMESSVSSVCAVIAGWIAGFEEIAAEYAGDRVEFVAIAAPCPMSDSLKAGWRRLQDGVRPGAVMISLADKPLVGPGTIDTLIGAYLKSDRPICVPVNTGIWGHPVIISSELDREIMELQGDQGARELLARHRDEVEQVAINSDEVLVDVDSIDDWDILKSRLLSNE
ncbi:MAG: nucleotidyltransferase family protein [Candidatus Eisenbacteria bacterium]